jgi:pyruvate kinase
VIALAADEAVRRWLSLVWGVTACPAPRFEGGDAVFGRIADVVRGGGLVRAGERVVITGAWPLGRPGVTNLVHVATV